MERAGTSRSCPGGPARQGAARHVVSQPDPLATYLAEDLAGGKAQEVAAAGQRFEQVGYLVSELLSSRSDRWQPETIENQIDILSGDLIGARWTIRTVPASDGLADAE
jgi:hypothetical protein